MSGTFPHQTRLGQAIEEEIPVNNPKVEPTVVTGCVAARNPVILRNAGRLEQRAGFVLQS
jgi:hypothetical protein